MLEGRENGDAAAIEKVAIMRKDVTGCGHGPDLGASEQTEGFGREGGRTAESDFKEAGKEGLGFCLSGGELSGGGMRRGRDSKRCRLCIEYRLWDDLPSDFEGGRRHWGELCGDGEDAIEFAIGERCCQGGSDTGKDSVY